MQAKDKDFVLPGSTDVGEVSWIAPLSMLNTTCWPLNASAHSWGVVATGGIEHWTQGDALCGKGDGGFGCCAISAS